MTKKTKKFKQNKKFNKNNITKKKSKHLPNIAGGNVPEDINKINGNMAFNKLENLSQSQLDVLQQEHHQLSKFVEQNLSNCYINKCVPMFTTFSDHNITMDTSWNTTYVKLNSGQYNVVFHSNETKKVVRIPKDVNANDKDFILSLWNWKYCENKGITPHIYRYSNINEKQTSVIVSTLGQELLINNNNNEEVTYNITGIIDKLTDSYLIHCDIKPGNLVVDNNEIKAIDLDYDFLKTHDIILKAIKYSFDCSMFSIDDGAEEDTKFILNILKDINDDDIYIIKNFSNLLMSLLFSGTANNIKNVIFDKYICLNDNNTTNEINYETITLFKLIVKYINSHNYDGYNYFWCIQATLSHYCGINSPDTFEHFIKTKYLISDNLRQKMNEKETKVGGNVHMSLNPIQSNYNTFNKKSKKNITINTPSHKPNIINNINYTLIPPWKNKTIIKPENKLIKNFYESTYYKNELLKIKQHYNAVELKKQLTHKY